MKSALLAILLFTFATSSGETVLSGPIQTSELNSSGSPYRVDQDVTIPAGKTLAIKEGCVLLFNNFTGLRVEGALSVEGTAERPVIFSSINDGDDNPFAEQLPNSFDWNGITLEQGANAFMKNFKVKYSVFGVRSRNPGIQIENGVFNQNGQFNFTINDKVQDVKESSLFSYNTAANAPAQSAAGSVSSNAKSASTKEPTMQKNVFLYACLAVGVIGAGVGIYYGVRAGQDTRKLDDLAANPGSGTTADWDKTEKSKNQSTLLGTIIGGLGGVGLIGFGLTFAF